MDDKAAQAIRAKRDSSMRVGVRLVREGRAAGFVTAGNTGAAMATAKMVLGALPGVDRPALAAVFPTALRTGAMLLDVGANVDCKPHNLEQFAVMGEIYFRSMFGTKRPRVGLLSIGEEETKGNELTRESFQLLKHLPINFVGNVEGRDLYNGHVDVIVADGFVGNVALKTSEGVANLVRASSERNVAARRLHGRWAICCRAARSSISKSASITPSMAALRCSGSKASASSRTDRRTRMPSRMRSAWRRNSPRAGSTTKSKRELPPSGRRQRDHLEILVNRQTHSGLGASGEC